MDAPTSSAGVCLRGKSFLRVPRHTHSQADSTNHHQRIPNAAQSGRQQGSMRRRKKVMFLCHVVTAAPSGDPLAIHVRRLLTPGKDKASIVVAKEVPVNRVNE